MAVSDIDARRMPTVDDQTGPTVSADTVSLSVVRSRAMGAQSFRKTLGASPVSASVNNGAPFIKVLVVYTSAAAAGQVNIVGAIQAAIDESNTVYSNSGIQQTLVIAGISQIAYNEAGKGLITMVNELKATNDGYADDVHPLRSQLKADVVVMVYNNDALCGWSANIGSTFTSAFAIVHASCLNTTNLTLPHEIGHLQGARHDYANDTASVPRADGHGYVDPNRFWRTVMAIGNPCGFCDVVPYCR